MAAQLALTLPLNPFFVGVGAKGPYSPQIPSFLDWVTKYLITYSLFPLLSLGVWCPFCAPGGGHIPRHQAPASEALPKGLRIAEGVNVLVHPPPRFRRKHNPLLMQQSWSR